MATLKVRGGLSAPLVNAIPSTWDPQWFRRWITDFLNQTQLGAGVTDINGGSGSIVLTGTPNQIAVSAAVAGTITLTFQPNVIIPAPVAGAALTVSGNGVSSTVVLNGPSGAGGPFTLQVNGSTQLNGPATVVGQLLGDQGIFALGGTFPGVAVSSAGLTAATLGSPSSDVAYLSLINAGSPADEHYWSWSTNSDGSISLYATNDADTASNRALFITRTGNVISTVTIGNATNLPTIALDGATTISTPAAGVALTVNGLTGQATAIFRSPSTAAAIDVEVARTAAGTANTILAGANLVLLSGSNSSTLQNSGNQFEIWQFNGTASQQTMFWNSNFGATHNAPVAGTSLTINGLGNTVAVRLVSANTSTNAQSDLLVTRPSTTINGFALGTCITLQDLAGATFSIFQHAGGQTEIWQNTSQLAFWNTNRTFQLNAPASGVTLQVLQSNGGIGQEIVGSGIAPAGSIFPSGGRAMMIMNGADALLEFQSSGTSEGYIYSNTGELRFAGRSGVALNFYSNDIARLNLTTAGNLTLNAPASGIAMQIFGTGTNATLQVNNSTSGSGSSNICGFTNDVDADVNFVVSQVGAASKFATISPSVNVVLRFGGFSTNTTAGLQGWGNNAGGYVDMTPDKGTGTVQCTVGFTTTPSVTGKWWRVGSMAFLEIPAITGTATGATGLTYTVAFPTGFAPTTNKAYPFYTTDNGLPVSGEIAFGPGGMSQSKTPIAAFVGTCGFNLPVVIAYPID